MEARKYQIEFFKRAIDSNIVAFLGTGTGKTLISILLIQHYNASFPGGCEKKTYFVCPTINLVMQQAERIRNCTDLMVAEIHGQNKKLSDMNSSLWKLETAAYQVVCITPQSLLFLFRHGMLQMSMINLLVIDECHHCFANNPIALIMREFYASSAQKPRIFGMTASPLYQGSTIEKCKNDLMQLQTTLDSKIVSLEPKAIEEFSQKCEFIIVEYLPASIEELDFSFLGSNQQKDAADLQQNLGKFAASWYAHDAPRQLKPFKRPNPEDPNRDDDSSIVGPQGLSRPSSFNGSNSSRDGKVLEDDAIFNMDRPYTDKVLKLMNIISKHDGRIMVFVHTRLTAKLLCKILNRTNKTCGFLVGSAESKSNIDSGENREQVKTLAMFNSGLIQILVVTRVAEEGIDIPSCSVVVIFDIFRSHSGFVQSRGRAREKNSKFYILVEKNNNNHLDIIAKAQIVEDVSRQLCNDVVEYKIQAPDSEVDRLLLGYLETPIITEEGAFLRSSGALQVMHWLIEDKTFELINLSDANAWKEYLDNYLSQCKALNASCLEYDILERENPSGPAYKCTFKFNEQTLIVFGSVRATHVLARKDCALEVCRWLLVNNHLSKNLLPEKKALKKELDHEYFLTIPEAFKPSDNPDYYLCICKSDRRISIALVVYEEMQTDFPMLHPSRPNVTIECIKTTFEKHQLEDIKEFSSYMFESVNSPSDFLVVLFIDGAIAWDEMKRVRIAKQTSLDSMLDNISDSSSFDFADCVVITKHNGMEYRVLGLSDLSSLDTFKKQNRLFSYKDYFEEKGYSIKTPERKLLAASIFSTNPSYMLGPAKKYKNREVHLPIDICDLYPTPWCVLEQIRWIPSILERLFTIIQIQKIKKQLDLKLSESMLFTLFCAKDVGYGDYERHEFLGDSFLKYIVCLDAYHRFPHYGPGRLTEYCHATVSNKNLCIIGKKLGVQGIVTVPNSEHWKAFQFGPRIVSDKTIADVIEGLIGACYLQSVGDAIDLVIKLGLVSPNFMDSFKPLDVDESLFKQAMTHSSYSSNNYERLEFLGDGILDLLVSSYLFEKFPDADPHMLSLFKSASVRNESLSRMSVDINLHKQLLIEHRVLEYEIEQFVQYYTECKENPVLRDTLPPKVLGDIFESWVACHYLHSNCLNVTKSKCNVIYDFIENNLDMKMPECPIRKLFETCKVYKLIPHFEYQGMDTCNVLINGYIVGNAKSEDSKRSACEKALNSLNPEFLALLASNTAEYDS